MQMVRSLGKPMALFRGRRLVTMGLVVVVVIGSGVVVMEAVDGRLVGAGPRISVEGGFTQTRTWTGIPPMTWISMWQRCPLVVGVDVEGGAGGAVVGGARVVLGVVPGVVPAG
jgi:hypothetical protein